MEYRILIAGTNLLESAARQWRDQWMWVEVTGRAETPIQSGIPSGFMQGNFKVPLSLRDAKVIKVIWVTGINSWENGHRVTEMGEFSCDLIYNHWLGENKCLKTYHFIIHSFIYSQLTNNYYCFICCNNPSQLHSVLYGIVWFYLNQVSSWQETYFTLGWFVQNHYTLSDITEKRL